MSEASKPTPGPWKQGYGQGASCVWIGGHTQPSGSDMGRESTWIDCNTKDNATLIAEAGTVHHETGLTPRQLVEQRDALVNALEELISGVLDIRGIDVEEYRPKEFRIARAALALVKGGEK